MKIKIKIDGVSQRKVERFVAEQPKAFSKAVKVGLLRMGLEVRNQAGENAPYLSGNLRRSLTSKSAKGAIYEYSRKGLEQSVAVGSNLVYARIQEFGGRTGRGGKGGRGKRGATIIRARQFLTPAFERMEKGRGSKILGQEIEAAINKI